MSEREPAPGTIGDSNPRRAATRTGQVIALLGAILIGSLTLMPAPPDPRTAEPMTVFCLVCGPLGAVDVILNILLFVPFGFGLRTAGLSGARAQLVVVTVTVTVELLQLTVITGRDGTVGDVVANSVGGAIGIFLAGSWRQIVFPAPRAGRALRTLGGVAWLGVWALSAYLTGRSLPVTLWFSQVPSEGVYREDFPGTVIGATLNGVLLGNGPTQSAELRSRVLRDGVRLEATAVTGRHTGDPASIVAVIDDQHNEILMLGQDGTDLVFRVLFRASAYRLRPPTIRMPGILADSGDTVRVSAAFRDERYSLSVVTGHGLAERIVAVSPSWGWTLLMPYDYAMGPEAALLTALWIAGMLVPLGYWAGREASPRIGAVAFLAVVVCLALAGVPLLAGLGPVHWSEWAAACSGIALGVFLGRRSSAAA